MVLIETDLNSLATCKGALHKSDDIHESVFLFQLLQVTGPLSEGSFVRNVVVQIPKFDAKPNPNPNPDSNPNPSPNPNPNSMPIGF